MESQTIRAPKLMESPVNFTKTAAVLAFLSDVLASGEVEVPVIESRARTAGLLREGQKIEDAKPFKGAKRKLGVRSRRVGFGSDGRWFWRLETLSSPEVKAERTVPAARSSPDPEDGYAVDHSRSLQPFKDERREYKIVQPSEIPAEWTHGLMILETRPVPRDVPRLRWDQFVGDCQWFIRSPEEWAARAQGLGWSTSNLFACACVRPFDYLASAGLLWLLRGGRLKTLSRHSAIIVDATGTEHTFHRLNRRPSPIATRLPWMLR